jgi:hypothetical protein
LFLQAILLKKTRVANSTKERVAVIVLVPFLAKRGDAVADSNPKIRGRRPQQVGESVSQAQFAILVFFSVRRTVS